jgi:hypothetical protein
MHRNHTNEGADRQSLIDELSVIRQELKDLQGTSVGMLNKIDSIILNLKDEGLSAGKNSDPVRGNQKVLFFGKFGLQTLAVALTVIGMVTGLMIHFSLQDSKDRSPSQVQGVN